MSEIKRQGFWYIFAGASAALIELILFQALYIVFGQSVLLSNVSATLLATAYNFLVNRNVTFKSSSNPIRSLVLYICLFLINMTVSTIVIGWLIDIGVHSLLAKAVMQVCVTCWNFILYRKFVFR